MSRSSRAVLILGPHRSGTSAVARVLNLLGVALGDDLLPPRDDNRLGFWEHREVFEIHERLLAVLGLAWHDYLPPPAGWLQRPEVRAVRQDLVAFLRRELAGRPLWGVKDPRMAPFLPLWLGVLEELEAELRVVLVVRNPLEVVGSLQRRQGFPFEKCLLLYLSEILPALHHTRGRPRAFVSYDRLLADWRGMVADLTASLEIDWPRPPVDRDEEIDAFLRPSERHHRHRPQALREHPLVPRWCADLHEALEAASRSDAGRIPQGELEEVAGRAHDAFFATTALLLPELDHLRSEAARLEERAERARGELAKVQGHLTSLLSSRLYRYSRLPRRLWYQLARLR